MTVDRATRRIYEEQAPEWERRREPRDLEAAAALGAAAAPGTPRIDLGCGPGRHAAVMGSPVIALDAAAAMLRLARANAPGALLVQGDLASLPFRDRSIGGAWARMSYQHLPRADLPMALAHLHWVLNPGAPARIAVLRGAHEGHDLPGDDFPGRFFAGWEREALADVVEGAGFDVEETRDRGDITWLSARRLLSLPDTVGAGMRLLVCGLNPSIYSAERGVGFARPGNRFWGAAVGAGVLTRPMDARHAVTAHGVGITDLVKRATVSAADLTADEYRAGLARVERLAAWLQPQAVCFVGLDGWRKAVDRRAAPGWQPRLLGESPAYVMPSTSGLNARTSLGELAEHLRAAAAGPIGPADRSQ